MNRPILDNVLPTLLGPVRALLDKKADKKEVAAKLGEKADAAEVVKQLSEKANADEIVKTVNGLTPDESGNVDVSGLPEGASPYMQLVTDSEGNAKWEERLAYTTEPVETVLMEEQEVSFQIYDGMGGCTSPVNVDLTEGTTYIVTFDGTDYECICAATESLGCYIGNGGLAGLEDTGEPFAYACTSQEYIWVASGEETTHTIKLVGNIRQSIPISTKYLPVASDDTLGVVKKSDFVKAYIFPNLSVDCYEMRAAIEEFNAGKASIVWRGSHVSAASIDAESDIWLRYDDGTYSPYMMYKYSKSGNYFYKEESSQRSAAESEIHIADHGTGGLTFRFMVSESGIPSITDYQGSTTFWTSASVPTPTTSDAGKFLRVQADGTWGVEAVANAEEASF